MVTYDIIDRWVFEQSSVPENESRKEVQIVRDQNRNRIYVRTAYYGPSGRYGQNAPTFDISEDNQQQLMSALSEAFPKAREIRRKEKIEETFEESDFDAEDLQKLADFN